MTQYLDENGLRIVDHNLVSINDLGKSDSYNEELIKEKILKFKKDEIVLLMKVAIQMAIVGYGNKNYGFVHHNGKQVDLVTIFKALNINYTNKLQDKLQEDDLTPRRLIRFFRYHIMRFIRKNNTPSYLWTKYSPKDTNYLHICFPGAEHLIENENEASYLYQTYNQLDTLLNTKFTIRLERVFQARGLTFKNTYDNTIPFVFGRANTAELKTTYG